MNASLFNLISRSFSNYDALKIFMKFWGTCFKFWCTPETRCEINITKKNITEVVFGSLLLTLINFNVFSIIFIVNFESAFEDKNRWIGTSRVVFLKNLRLKTFPKSKVYFQPSQTSEMKHFWKNS